MSNRSHPDTLFGGIMPDPAIPSPPQKPADYECCHRGCCPCIFDYYYDALERWEARVRDMGLDCAAILKAAS